MAHGGQGDCAIDRVIEVSGLLQLGHAFGIRSVGCLEIPARPICESQERHCSAAPEMVVNGCEFERPPDVCHGFWYIAPNQG